MESYQHRVIDEESSLSEKISKLDEFIQSSVFPAIDYDEQLRLKQQLQYMKNYDSVLRERIKYFYSSISSNSGTTS